MLCRKYKFLALCMCCLPVVAKADAPSLDDALRATYTACVGIDSDLAELKKMAGINTAVTAVGTATGVGATVVGVVKAKKDSEIENLEDLIKELHDLEQGKPEPTNAEREQFLKDFSDSYTSAVTEIRQYKEKVKKLNQQSKSLGTWRTGLVATSAVSNVAGAVIAGKNQVNDDLSAQIDNCKSAVKNLRSAMNQARVSGQDITEATQIANACGEFEYVDISKINNRAKGAMISSVFGATTGVAGTITSASANSNSVRNDNSDDGKQKEKNLNTAANVLSGTTALASGAATVFNATQISAIKKVADVAEKCTGVLQ